MRKPPVRAITFHEFHAALRESGQSGRPPGPHETMLDRLFTGLARATGLTARARMTLARRMDSLDAASAQIHTLHAQLNAVVDGGWRGLWTSLRICAGAA